MKQIKIETGLQEYRLNDKVTIEFNPTDFAFAGRLYDLAEELSSKQEEYENKVKETTEAKELFDFCKEIDAEMREKMTLLFGVDVITGLVGNVNAYAMAGGMPIWANIILAVMDEMDAKVKEEEKASKAKTNKYLKKYHN